MRLVFDRGTLLLLDAPDELPVGTLPGALWDPRVRAFRCPGYSLPALKQVLESRNVQVSDETSRHRLDRPIFRTPVELRPYQRAALAAWDLAGRRGVVVLPTGSGKTRLALAAIAQAGEPALCLVPTRVLLEQWVRATKELMGCEPGVFGDGERTSVPSPSLPSLRDRGILDGRLHRPKARLPSDGRHQQSHPGDRRCRP